MSRKPYRGPKDNKETNITNSQETNKELNLEVLTMNNSTEKKSDTLLANTVSTATEAKYKKDLDKELSRAEKKAARRQGMAEHGRLTLAEEYKEPGFRYRICNVLPGNIENYKTKGYEVVTHNLKSGSGRIDQPEADGTPMEVEVGGANGSMKGVWMRISEEDAQINDEIRADLAREQDSMVNKVQGIPQENLIGSVTRENLK